MVYDTAASAPGTDTFLERVELEYSLVEPEYDNFEATSFDEREYMNLKWRSFDINVENIFNEAGIGMQSIDATLIVSKAYAEDDILQLTFYMDLPADIMSEDTVVYQWAQLE